MRRLLFGAVLALAALALMPGAAKADTFTLSGCTDCHGLVFTLTATPVGTSTSHYTVTLAVNTLGFVPYTAGGQTINAISGVNFRISSGSSSGITASLTGNPGGSWVTLLGSLNNNGCGGGNGGFVCSAMTGTPFISLTGGGTLTWTWDVHIQAGTLLPGLDGGHIGASFENLTRNVSGQILSETIVNPRPPVVVPEPGTLMLLGSGLLGLAGIVRRRLS